MAMTSQTAYAPNTESDSRFSLGTKFTLAYLVLILLPLISLAVAYYVAQRNELRQDAENTVLLMGERKVNEIRAETSSLYTIAEDTLIRNADTQLYVDALQRNATPEQISSAGQSIERIWTDNASLVYIRLVNTQLDVVVERGLEDIEISRQTLGDLARSQLQTVISDIYAGPDGQPLVDIIVPFKMLDGRTIGYFVLTQDPARSGADPFPNIYEVLARQPAIANVPDANLFLYDYRGLLVATTSRRDRLFVEDFSNGDPLANTLAIDPRAVNRYGYALRNLGADVTVYDSPILDESVIGYYERIGNTRWTLAIEISETDIYAPMFSEVLPRLGVLVTLLAVLGAIVMRTIYVNVAPPLESLTNKMNTFSFQQPPEIQSTTRSDELGQLQNAFRRMSDYIQTAYRQQQINAESRSKHLNLLYDLNKVIGVQDTDFLMAEAVRLLREQYEHVDHAQIFLLDKSRRTLILRAGTGDLGRRLLVQEHQQALNEGGVIANTALLGTSTLIGDVANSLEANVQDMFRDTRSLLVVPVRTRDEVIGVLDIHSNTLNAFTQEDVDFFNAVGVEVGIAVELHEEINNPIVGVAQQVSSERSRVPVPNLTAVAGDFKPEEAWSPLQQQAMNTQFVANEEKDGYTYFALPIMLRDEVLGAIEWKIESGFYTLELIQTASELVSRLALAVDNARLFEQSQRLVDRERRVNDITQKMTSHNDIRQILQVAVKELGQALGTPDTVIRLNVTHES